MIPAAPATLQVRSNGLSPSLRPFGPGKKVRSLVVRGSDQEEIYIGFPKNDYSPREGRQGRVIKDDPAKYPDRDEFAGGWAGGEAGLWKFREEIKAELEQIPREEPRLKPDGKPAPGKAPIYVGFGKDELALKNTGMKGRVIYDDAAIYPDKDDVGFLAGATGGFAGGELGVKTFAEKGEVKLRKAGEPGGQGVSALEVIFLLLGSGGVGAYLYLNGAFDEASTQNAEQAIQNTITVAKSATATATNQGTDFTPVLIGVALVGGLGLTVAAKSAADSAAEFLQENASKYLTLGLFAAAVLLLAKLVIES